jgi:uncharacterized membrane protein YebE (DUF533 family)
MHDLAEHVEITFNAHRLSLTDVRTARAYDTTLQIVTGMLEGAHAEGIIDEAQRGKLGELFQGMRQAPEIIAEE